MAIKNLGRVTGLSAYEIWLQQGNTGTEEDFLNSLIGDTGRGILKISKTATSGLVDTYTITYTDGSTSTYTVTNGANSTGGSGGSSIGISRFYGKKANFLGDSQTDDAGNYKSKFFYDWLKEILGLDVTNNYGYSGTTIMPIAGQSKSFLDRYSSMSDDADLIVVWGGTNDYHYGHALGTVDDTTSTTFCGAVNQLCKGLINKYPQKDILFVTPTPRGNVNSAVATQEEYADAIIKICGKYCIPVYDAYRNCQMPIIVDQAFDSEGNIIRKYTVDGLHLNDLGHEILGKSMANFILYGPMYGIQSSGETSYITDITLDKTSLSLEIGGSEQLTATYTPEDATVTDITWSSSNSAIATVVNGFVTGIADGTVTITAKAKGSGITETCNVVVGTGKEVVKVTGVSLNTNTATMEVDGTIQLTATVEPENAENTNVVWSTNNSNCTVENGLVTALNVGDCIITVTTEDGGYTDTCTITIEEEIIPVNSVTLDNESLTLTVGDTQQLTATVLPEDATDKTVIWSASNSNCSVENGLVTAKTEGDCVITATSGGHSATCNVTVEAVSAPVSPVDGKTVTFTEKGSWPAGTNLTLLVKSADIKSSGSLTVRAKIADATQTISAFGKGMQAFQDETGELNNGKYKDAASSGYVTSSMEGDIITATGNINTTSFTYDYIKIPVTITTTEYPVSFKIESLTLEIGGTYIPIQAVGGFYAQEGYSEA